MKPILCAVCAFFVCSTTFSQDVKKTFLTCTVDLTVWMNDTGLQTSKEKFDVEINEGKNNFSIKTELSLKGTYIDFNTKGHTSSFSRLKNIKNHSSDGVLYYTYEYGEDQNSTENSIKINRYTGSIEILNNSKFVKGNSKGSCIVSKDKMF